MNLNNRIGTLTTVQTAREVKTSNGCEVSITFQSESDPTVEKEVAKMLLAVFAKNRSVAHEAGIMSVQSFN